MPDITREPYRRIALPFAGDPWAQPGAQVPVPSNIPLLSIVGESLRVRVIGYDGMDPDAVPVDMTTATHDFTVVKLRRDPEGNVTLARTTSFVQAFGTEIIVGDRQITEDDVSDAELVAVGIPSVTDNGLAAIWIWIDAGARYAQVTSG